MVLNIGNYEYLPSLTDEAGARVLIHPQTDMPFPDHDGISTAPGHTNSIAIKKVRISAKFQIFK